MKIFTAVIMFLMASSYFCFAQPTISVTPDTIEVTLDPGDSTEVDVFVHNGGDSTLIWTAMVVDILRNICVKCNPDSGEVDGGGIDTIQCEVYECDDDTNAIRVNSNDPVNSVVDVPVYIYTTMVGIEDENSIPKGFAVSQNYPNPFNPVTSITYQLPLYAHVELTVFDNLGRSIRTLTNSNKQTIF